MAHVITLAKLVAVAGKSEELKGVLADLIRAVQSSEPGTLDYAGAQDTTNPDVFWVYEVYASAEAADAHMSGTALAEVGPRLMGLLAGAPEVHRLEPFGGTRLWPGTRT